MSHPSGSRLRSIVGGSIGNLVEWYDWYAYSAFSLYFSAAFFPPANPTVQLLNAAAVFAVGFFMRPIGGWMLGRYADKHGRRAALTLSVILMCSGSLLIAITPSYTTIGVAAPALLLVARLLQGLSVGGEYGASATYLSEMAGQRHRGFWSSFQYVTLIGGQLLALAVLLTLQATLSTAQLQDWGWRVPFVIGALFAVVAIGMRRSLEETSDFQKDAATRGQRTSAATIRGLLEHPRAVLTVVGLTAGGTVAFYTFTTYAQKFLVNTAGFTKEEATFINAVTLMVYIVLQPIVGGLSDRIGRRPVLMAFAIIGTLGTVPLLEALAHTRTIGGAIGLLLLALTAVSGYTAINAVVKAELFPTHIRALGVGLPYAIAVSLFGGTAEYIALWFKNIGHESWFYWYVTACIAGSLIVYATMQESSRLGHMGD
ncbi:MAG: alpha-ketoglutarate permease [Gemmatimonadota bacterium]